MGTYRKKPVVIKAWKAADLITAASKDWSKLPAEVAAAYEKGGWVFCPDCIYIPTLEGDHRADRDDMVIMGVKGEFYPCKPDIFAATYEEEE